MRKTRIIALLLVVAMIASMVPSVFAADPYEVSITDASGNSTATVGAGESVMLNINLAGNPGISGVALKLQYPEGWTLVGVQNKKLFNDKAEAGYTPSKTTADNPYQMIWNMPYGTTADPFGGDPVGGKLSFENGLLAVAMFTVPADAVSGEYVISLTTEGLEGSNYKEPTDANGVIVTGEAIKGLVPDTSKNFVVTVKGTEPEVPAGAACPEHADVTEWTEVAENEWAAGGALTSGHYKLTGNQATTAALTVAEGETVCIDLNGYNITAGAKAAASSVSYRVFENAGTLAILDSTAAEVEGVYTAGTISGGAIKSQGTSSVYSKDGHGGNVSNTGTFTLVSGIIADGYLTGGAYDTGDNGANIYSKGGVLNIKGGIIRDGYNMRTSQTGTLSGGGNIYADGTDVNITGGIISGGRLYTSYGYTKTTARTTKQAGGNIYIVGGSLDIENATIANGKIEIKQTSKQSTNTVSGVGGNIYAVNTNVNVKNSVITGGTLIVDISGGGNATTVADATAQGGNIYFAGTSYTLNIDADSVITEGEASAKAIVHADNPGTSTGVAYNYRGGNIYMSSGTVNVYGKITNGYGQRGGAIFTPGSTTINVYEGAEISGSTSTAEYGHEITTTGKSSVLNIYGGTITSDKTDEGYTIYALYAPVNIYGGLVANTGSGRAINTYYGSSTAAVITMNAGTVVGYFRVADKCEAYINGGTIDTFTVSGTGKLEIGAGVTSTQDPTAYAVNCEAVVKGDKVVTYATLADALAASAAGATITLVKDITAAVVSLKTGVTLELNGKILTADEFTSALAQTLDSVGGGKIIAESVSFDAANKQLPVTIGNETTFENIEFAFKGETVDNKHTYKFYVKSEAAATMIDDAILAGAEIAVEVKVSWTNAKNENKSMVFFLNEADLEALAQDWDNKMVVLTINDVSGVTDLTCTAQIRSGTVVVTA